VRVSVPFNFTVGDKALPAGNYSIAPAMDGTIQIRNRDTHAALLTQAAADSNRSPNGGVLVFDKYAGRYFLHEILCESAAMNLNLPATKQQKSTRMEEAKLHHDSGSQILVAINRQ
jgi:hypothetical protein